MVRDDFVNLHTHTHASRFDGLGNAEQFVERAHEMGQTAISFTEHGNLCGLYEQHLATLKGNMKLLPGVEAYLADDAEQRGLDDAEKAEIKAQYTEKELQAEAMKEAQRVRRERDHITVWAQTQEGLRNLYRLTSWSWNEGFYCLLPGQEIMTSSGVKPVEEIGVGDRVLTHKGRLRSVESTFSRNFEGKIYGIRLNNRYGRVTWMTGEHPVLVRTRDGKVDWVRADEIKGGRARKTDSIGSWASFVCLPKIRPETETSTVKVSDWVKSWNFDGKTFSKEIPRRTMPSTYSYFRCDDEILLDYEFGMFLGLFCAEGGFGRTHGFEFSFHQEEVGFIELVKKVLKDKFGLKAASSTREDRPGYKGISLRAYSQVVTEFMQKMCGRGSANMHLPPFSFESPREFRRGLLDGIFGGDAGENDTATIFTQTSRVLSWQVRCLAAEFYESFPCVVETHDGNPNHSNQFRTNYAPRGPRRAGRHTLADDSYVYRPVAEVLVRDYAGPVFNFGVEEDESYVSDFAMHNCKPRIDIKRLRQFGKGLAVSTGCPGGVVTSPLRAGKTDVALERMQELADIFGDRLYVEIMPHQMEDCPDLASRMVKLADRFGAKVIATQDAHYPKPGDAHPQEVLLCINTRDRMSRPPKGADCTDGRFCFDHQHYYLRDRTAMAEAMRKLPGLTEKVIQSSLDETVRFADRVKVLLYDPSLSAEQVAKGLLAKPGEYLVAPELPPQYASYDRWLMALVTEASVRRNGVKPMDLPEEYRERLLLEMSRIIQSGFSRYFIAVWEMIDWARKAGIAVGPGRGSVGGSYVAHLIGLSELDPVRHGLSFDRFINVGRKDYPDIDTDFDYRHRGRVIEHLQELYGHDRVALIGTLNTYGGKAALNEVGKANGIAQHEIAAVTGLIVTAIEEENQDDGSLRDVLAETEVGQAFSDRYPDVVGVAQRLEGLIRAAGVHAAGVVVSSVPLADIVPLESRKRDNGTRMATIAWPMGAVEAAGLVKLDALGLTTLGWIATALEWIEAKGEKLVLSEIPFDDQPSLDLLSRNEFVGIFQYDTPGSRRLCADFTFSRFEDVSVMTALNRPGPTKSGLAQLYLDRAADVSKIPPQHPAVEAATKETLGCIIYQEQVVALAMGLCGYDAAEGDTFRKKISKKKGLSDEEKKFIEGAQANGMSYEDAFATFSEIKEFAAYCFNKCIDIHELVMTPSGPVQIGMLKKGDQIVVAEDHGLEIGTVTEVFDVEIQPRYRMEFEGGESVICTSKHVWPFRSGEASLEEAMKEGRIDEGKTKSKWVRMPMRGSCRDPGSVVESRLPTEGDEEDQEARGVEFGLRTEFSDDECEIKPFEVLRGMQDSQEGDSVGNNEEGLGRSPRRTRSDVVRSRQEDVGKRGHSEAESRSASELARKVAGSGCQDHESDAGRAEEGRVRFVQTGGDDFGDAESSGFQAEQAGEGLENTSEAGGFLGEVHRRDRWDSPLQTHIRRQTLRSDFAKRQGAESLGERVWEDAGSNLSRLFHVVVRPASGLCESDSGSVGESCAGDYFYRRLVRVVELPPGPVVDIQVSSRTSHFVMANGAVSHNSHAYSYGLLAYWTAYLKVHYPAEFYCGALANESRPERQVRLAQDARRAGIAVGAPEINSSGGRFAIRQGRDGKPEIVGAAVDLKGVGQKATDAIVLGQPYDSIVDFARRTDRAVTAKTFETLAKATAFRYLFDDARYLVENAKAVWAAAKKGIEPDLPPDWKPWTDAEATLAATEVYPLYVADSGLSTFELEEKLARKKLGMPLYPVGDEELEGLDCALVFGRVQGTSLYPEEKGRSGRATLLGWDGTEIACRMDVDCVDRYYAAVKKAGVHVVALCRFFRGKASSDAFWRVSELDSTSDPVLQWIQSPGDTSPGDPARALRKRRSGDDFVFDGIVFRIRHHEDKRGRKMATLGVLGRESAIQALVFADAWDGIQESVELGERYRFRAKKLDGGAVQIETVSHWVAPATRSRR